MESLNNSNWDEDDLGEPIYATVPSAPKTGKKFGTHNGTEFQSPTNKTTDSFAFIRRDMSQGCSTSNSRGGMDVSNTTTGALKRLIVPSQSASINRLSTSKQPLALDPFHRVDGTNTTVATHSSSTNPPDSWLAARLVLGGMSQALAQECEQNLVHTEGFSNVRDLAECPPSMSHHAYLTRVGIVGLGTQRQVLRLHSELHAQYNQKLQQQLQLQLQPLLSTNVPTAEVAIATTTSTGTNTDTSANTSANTTCATNARNAPISTANTGTSAFSSSNKRAWSEIVHEYSDNTLAHAYVPAPPNKRFQS